MAWYTDSSNLDNVEYCSRPLCRLTAAEPCVEQDYELGCAFLQVIQRQNMLEKKMSSITTPPDLSSMSQVPPSHPPVKQGETRSSGVVQKNTGHDEASKTHYCENDSELAEKLRKNTQPGWDKVFCIGYDRNKETAQNDGCEWITCPKSP